MSFRPYVDWYRLKVGVFVPCYIRKSINLNEMMIKNKILALLTVGLLLLMVMPTLARQQQRVRGIVRDSLTSDPIEGARSEEHPSALQSLMSTSYDVICLQKKKKQKK